MTLRLAESAVDTAGPSPSWQHEVRRAARLPRGTACLSDGARAKLCETVTWLGSLSLDFI
jgi:hypothetical protein